jgi:ABC-2 type transport system permease protein
MIRRGGKYLAIFRAQLSDRLAYPVDLLTQSISILIFVFIFLQLWKTTYSATGQQAIAGLSLQDTIWYFLAAEMIMVSSPRVYRTISDAVKDGSIAYLLNKPYDFILYHASVGLGDLVARLTFNILIGSAFTWLLVGPPPAPESIPALLIAYFLAWLINFCTSALIGLAAFALEEVAPLDWIYNKLLLVAGGVLIPLDFFPEWLRDICQSLPFAYTIYGPARFFIEPSWQRYVTLILGQLGWISVMATLLFLVYRRGTSWLNINGG